MRNRNIRCTPTQKLTCQNLAVAKKLYPQVTELQLVALREINRTLRLSVSSGDLIIFHGKWYVTHSGLLRIAERRQCSGITTELEQDVSQPSEGRWVFRAIVCKSGS